jgi:hypothetical protein
MASVTVRPRRIRRVCWVLAPVVVIFFAVLAWALGGAPADIGETGGGAFSLSDQIAMAALGVLGAGGILLLARPRVTANERTITIQNILGGYRLPWEVVREVRFERGSPWATLELQDDDVVAVMAVQAADKEHAVAAVIALRDLLAASRSPQRPPS